MLLPKIGEKRDPLTNCYGTSSHTIDNSNHGWTTQCHNHSHNIRLLHIVMTTWHTSVEWGPQTLRQACYRENPESAMCVQNLNDSRGLAIRITYRISLRSSSLWEPRHPPLKVVMYIYRFLQRWCGIIMKRFHNKTAFYFSSVRSCLCPI